MGLLKKKRNKPKDSAKRSFSEFFYPARPEAMMKKAKSLAQKEINIVPRIGLPNGRNFAYVQWLKSTSMLANAQKQARLYSGTAAMWQNPYARPQPKRAAKMSSVWYTAYPASTITQPKTSLLQELASQDLWDAFAAIGITGLHTGPMKIAGGLDGWEFTPSIDGHFDRISMEIDPLFGTAADFTELTTNAKAHGGVVIDDVVPAHTGKGPDFQLATMAYHDYTGIYHMVEIAKDDWPLLPTVPKGHDSINLSADCEQLLKDRGYIVGKLQRVMFFEPGVKETNWSATKKIMGSDGIYRRWVYLHYFKEGQPSINWLDPSFAGMQLVIGDALQSLKQLGTTGLRLDANGFLGVERSGDDSAAWSQGHPLSVTANELIASMVRKAGGFTFQELNLSIDDIKTMSEGGSDLSYDFASRPAYQHAMATGDVRFLQLMLREALRLHVYPWSLVHALQNHDELTYELVHLWTTHAQDTYEFRGKHVTGLQLRDIVRQELLDNLCKNKPYNLPFTQNGIACTSATIVAAALGYRSIDTLSTDQQQAIQRGHLLMAFFNAMQPGVFALSGWDLVGALTVDAAAVSDLLADGDTRWINRGSYDIMGHNKGATQSAAGLPIAPMLYGNVRDQLANPLSFASQLKTILAVRQRYHLATAKILAVPPTNSTAVVALVHQLESGQVQVSILNFSNKPANARITCADFTPKSNVLDMFTEQIVTRITADHYLEISLAGHGFAALLLEPVA